MDLNKQFLTALETLRAKVDDWRERDNNESTFAVEAGPPTKEHTINAAPDVVAGDDIIFLRRKWERRAINRYGKLSNVVVGYEIIEGHVERESYGPDKQQHTFSVRSSDVALTLIKGRNLYAIGVWRKPWADESVRLNAAQEKHERGDRARNARYIRRSEMGAC